MFVVDVECLFFLGSTFGATLLQQSIKQISVLGLLLEGLGVPKGAPTMLVTADQSPRETPPRDDGSSQGGGRPMGRPPPRGDGVGWTQERVSYRLAKLQLARCEP